MLTTCIILLFDSELLLFNLELEWLQKKEHKFKTHNVEITVVCTPPSDEPLQSVPFDSSTASPHEPSDLIMEVSGFPSGNTDTELLEIYFESSKSGGCSDAVVNCSVIADGIAHIEFRSCEGMYIVTYFPFQFLKSMKVESDT